MLKPEYTQALLKNTSLKQGNSRSIANMLQTTGGDSTKSGSTIRTAVSNALKSTIPTRPSETAFNTHTNTMISVQNA